MNVLLAWVVWGLVAPMAVFVTLFAVFRPRPRMFTRLLPCRACFPVAWWTARTPPGAPAELAARREIES